MESSATRRAAILAFALAGALGAAAPAEARELTLEEEVEDFRQGVAELVCPEALLPSVRLDRGECEPVTLPIDQLGDEIAGLVEIFRDTIELAHRERQIVPGYEQAKQAFLDLAAFWKERTERPFPGRDVLQRWAEPAWLEAKKAREAAAAAEAERKKHGVDGLKIAEGQRRATLPELARDFRNGVAQLTCPERKPFQTYKGIVQRCVALELPEEERSRRVTALVDFFRLHIETRRGQAAQPPAGYQEARTDFLALRTYWKQRSWDEFPGEYLRARWPYPRRYARELPRTRYAFE